MDATRLRMQQPNIRTYHQRLEFMDATNRHVTKELD